MRTFDIIVDGRHIQSDLIVANLPVRNDIAAYYWLTINSELINHIIAEKAVSPEMSGIAFNASVDSSITKYETVDAPPVVLGANAEFQFLFPLAVDENNLELQQTIQETAQKIERVSLPISIGAEDNLDVSPLKSVGETRNAVEIAVVANEVKNSIINGASGYSGIALDTTLVDPFTVYYENATNNLFIGASVQSLSYLLHMRLIQSNINIGIDTINFDLYRSLGKLSARISVGADAGFAVEFFVNGENELEMLAEVGAFPVKLLDIEPDIMLDCEGSAALRRLRTLDDIAAFGTLADIDDMTLEIMYYEDIVG